MRLGHAATAVACLVLAGCASIQTDALEAGQTLRGAKIYLSPNERPVENGAVLIRGGRIAAVFSDAELAGTSPPLAPAACQGGVVLAGFYNSHVHLLGDAFANGDTAPKEALEKGLADLLTRFGFTTAVDIGSDRVNTSAVRRRVEEGGVTGPRLLTTGLPLFPSDGLPTYLEHLDPDLLARLPQPESVEAAVDTVGRNLDAGADGTKLFLVAPQRGQGPKRMADDIAEAATRETHRRGKLVFAHPTDLDGVRAALRAKVDVLAHPPLGTAAPWPTTLMQDVRIAGVHLVPTLKLLRHELAKERVPMAAADAILRDSVQEVGKFAAAGGKVLFGTDVDYMTDYDPTDEYELMAEAGMSAMQVLASLTTTPASLWNEGGKRGRIAAGMEADLVVLEGDPATDIAEFAKVKCAIRGGKAIYVNNVGKRAPR